MKENSLEPSISNKSIAIQTRIDATKNDKEKINLYNALGLEVQYNDYDQALKAFNQAVSLAKEKAKDDDSYLTLFSGSLRNLGLLFRDAGNYDKSLDSLHDALQVAEESRDLSEIAEILDYIGATYGRMAKYEETLKYSFRALKVAQNSGNKVIESEVLNTIGFALVLLNHHQEALDYLLQGLEIIKAGNKLDMIQNFEDSICNAYLGLGDYKNALKHGLHAIQLSEAINNPTAEIEVRISIVKVYMAMSEHKKALTTSKKSWELAEKYDLPREKCLAGKLLGELSVQNGDLAEAKKYLDVSLKLAKKLEIVKITYEIHKIFSAYYKKKGEYKAGLNHYEKYQNLKDSSQYTKAIEQYRSLYLEQQINEAKKDAEIYEKNIAVLTREIKRSQQLQAELHVLAATDPLTELNNRGHFFSLADKSLEEAINNDFPMSMIIMDIDHFKDVNDQYGHRIGDQVLVEVSLRITQSLRGQDISGRYGGEEFIVLLPETDLKDAERIAKRLHENITGTVIETEKEKLDIQISLGVAEKQKNKTISLDELVDMADKALYDAKKAGRNQIKLYSK